MNDSPFSVSKEDFEAAPMPSNEEAAALAQSIGMLLGAGMPILSLLQITAELLENAKLRRMLFDVHEAIKGGTTLSEPLVPYKEAGIVDEGFLTAMMLGEEEGCLDETMLSYAKAKHRNPLAALRGEMDLEDEVLRMMAALGSELGNGLPVLRSLRMIQGAFDEPFKGAITQIQDSIENGTTLSEAMQKQPEFFPRALAMLTEIGEMTGELDKILIEFSVE